jgi:hypothetical protein
MTGAWRWCANYNSYKFSRIAAALLALTDLCSRHSALVRLLLHLLLTSSYFIVIYEEIYFISLFNYVK